MGMTNSDSVVKVSEGKPGELVLEEEGKKTTFEPPIRTLWTDVEELRSIRGFYKSDGRDSSLATFQHSVTGRLRLSGGDTI